MSDMTSGFNIAENIYLSPQFEDLCGFREPEIAAILEKVAAERGMGPERVGEAMKMMRAYYDGYRFSSGSRGVLYNPTLVLYFLKRFQSEGGYPEEMLDDNLAIDRAKLDYIAGLPDGETLIWKTFDDSRPLTVQSLAYRFGIREIFHSPKDFRFMLSFLYYFGVLTRAGERDEYGEHLLRIPNLTIRSLYAERIRETLLPEPGEIDEAANVARQLYQKGQMGPLCEFVERKQFSVFDNRDYRSANELKVKAVFLTLLFNDVFYIMDSEPALRRGYGDLAMKRFCKSEDRLR